MENPILAEALHKNAFTYNKSNTMISPKIVVNEDLLKQRRDFKSAKSNTKMYKYYLYYAMHMMIPLYGLCTVIF